jgi:hypothetical protein
MRLKRFSAIHHQRAHHLKPMTNGGVTSHVSSPQDARGKSSLATLSPRRSAPSGLRDTLGCHPLQHEVGNRAETYSILRGDNGIEGIPMTSATPSMIDAQGKTPGWPSNAPVSEIASSLLAEPHRDRSTGRTFPRSLLGPGAEP